MCLGSLPRHALPLGNIQLSFNRLVWDSMAVEDLLKLEPVPKN